MYPNPDANIARAPSPGTTGGATSTNNYAPYSQPSPVQGPGLGYYGDYYTPPSSPAQPSSSPTSSPTPNTNTNSPPPNPQTTYLNVPGRGNMKLADAMGEGLVDQYGNLTDSMKNSASQLSDAQIQSIVAEYNGLLDRIRSQRQVASDTYNTGLTDVNNQINDAQNAASFQRNDLNRTSDLAQNQASQNYQTSQRLNREAARAAGSGASSSYLDMQGQTNNSYGQTQANISMDLNNRLQNIDQNMVNINNQAMNAKTKLANSYNQAMSQIAIDENATDAQKVAAIAQVRAQASQIASNIDLQVQQMKQQMEIAKAQIAAYSGYIGQANAGYTVPNLATNTVNTNYGPTNTNNSSFSGLNVDNTKKQTSSSPLAQMGYGSNFLNFGN